jgi:WhiB family redox-sensing transcriptional regulator
MRAPSQLPGPVATLWDWQLEGACRQANPELFFHPEGERGPERRSRGSQAIAVCVGCPVLQRCRDHVLRTREPYGVWGGMTEGEREAYHSAQDNPRRQPGQYPLSTPALQRGGVSCVTRTVVDA